MDQFITELKKIPPVTRFMCGSLLGVTVTYLLGIVGPYTLLFHSGMVIKRFQIWRLYTSFFLGPQGLALVFETLMFYNVTNELERNSYSQRTSDFVYQLLFVAPAIIAATYPLQASVFSHSFLLSLVYLYSRLAAPGTQTSIMGIVTVPVIFYPYIIITFDFLIGGPHAAALSAAGAVVGHIWWWSVWGGNTGSQGLLSNHARAPEWIRNLMGESRRPRVQPPAAGGDAQGLAQGGIHVTAPRRPATAGASATTSGYRWGSGQRLGS
ncbi:Der1-like family-domain-containing protein [Crepidotus variabilis]|uniref:Derlin n=1 Tax=Crepidotus variabilis TaxID=179855 RepID=A0A9P6EKF6_9AGAR|nr:Der1-like family-domain-containing protein [Crepidotus variabilis]